MYWDINERGVEGVVLWRVWLLPSFDWWANSSVLTPVPTFWRTPDLHYALLSLFPTPHPDLHYTLLSPSPIPLSSNALNDIYPTPPTSPIHQHYLCAKSIVSTFHRLTMVLLSSRIRLLLTLITHVLVWLFLSDYLSVCLSVYMKPVSENQSNSEHCQNYFCWHRLPWGSLFLWLPVILFTFITYFSINIPCQAASCKMFVSLSLNSVRTKNKRMSEINVDNFCLLRVETREITSSKQRNRWREALLQYIPVFLSSNFTILQI